MIMVAVPLPSAGGSDICQHQCDFSPLRFIQIFSSTIMILPVSNELKKCLQNERL